MKKYSAILVFLILFACKNAEVRDVSLSIKVNTVINNWHSAAANADYETYFDQMSNDAVFVGTDATENWSKMDFQAYAKPHFDQGKAWDFTTLERNLFFDKTGNIAWFDELLQTQMRICRGSGVLIKIDDKWKIKHYVLSMTIPNENSSQVIKIKTSEDLLIKNLKIKQ